MNLPWSHSTIVSWLLRATVCIGLAGYGVRSSDADELKLDAHTLLEKAGSENLHLSADAKSVELDRGELFEGDGPAAGYSYKPNEEKLSNSTWIKKELVIPNPQATKATLLVGQGETLEAIINGKPQPLTSAGKAGNYWQTYTFPPDALKAGKNEIILHGTGKVWIARNDEYAAGAWPDQTPPNQSGKSSDGGKSWDYDRLGTSGDVDGEYYVRIFLDHHRPRGTLTLPVLDAGNLAAQPVAAPVTSGGPVRINLKAETGTSARVSVQVRSGPTVVPAYKIWTNWQDLGPTGGVLQKPAGRFFQLKVVLATVDPLQTPKLHELVIEATPERPADWTRKLRVLESHNEEIVRSSNAFVYEPLDHPKLKEIRTRYKLDEVVQRAKGEFDLITRLAAWSSRQWSKGHLGKVYPAWDALEILKPYDDGTPVGGFCQQYNVVFLQACESFGINGRAVSLGAGDHGLAIRSGHEVVELWSNEYRKWVYVDGNAGWYFIDPVTKIPLSLWELRERQLLTFQGKAAKPVQLVKVAEGPYTWKGLDGWPAFLELRLIPRSNFLEEPAPLPLNQGMRGWFWTGHHVWTDPAYPASLLYGNRVNQRSNWEWTLNQAHFVLEATDTPGKVRVHLDTVTPGFETFLAKIDAGDAKPVPRTFLWELHPGKNRLEVRPRNKAGREGIASWIVLESP